MNSYAELYHHCKRFGSIGKSFYYNIAIQTGKTEHFILLEFDENESANEAISSSTFVDQGVPVHSRYLWFRAGSSEEKVSAEPDVPLHTEHGFNNDDAVLKTRLRGASSVSTQINVLFKTMGLDELGTRLRYIATRQIEQSLIALFPNIEVHPFGSSVNGFGRIQSDLDMILELNKERDVDPKQRLVFHQKETYDNSRRQMQREMDVIADIMKTFLPGVANVRKILNARVPIIKYNQRYLNLEVDLSLNNL